MFRYPEFVIQMKRIFGNPSIIHMIIMSIQKNLPNGKGSKRSTYGDTVDDYMINRENRFAFDREHDPTANELIIS